MPVTSRTPGATRRRPVPGPVRRGPVLLTGGLLTGGLLAGLLAAPAVAGPAPALTRSPESLSARSMIPAGSPDTAGSSAPGPAASSSSTSGMQYGVDVSSYQHPYNAAIDWRQVAASGQSFAIIKATESTSSGTYVNPFLQGDLNGAHAAGLVVGSYAFARPSRDATAQADAFASAIGRLPAPALPPVLDLEDSGGLSVASLQAWTRTFLGRLQARTGVVPMIYSGPSFWSTYMGGSTEFSGYRLWEAHYTSAPQPWPVGGWPSYTLWQFTDAAAVPGIASGVDQSRFSGTRAQLEAIGQPVYPSSVASPSRSQAGATIASPNGQYRALMQTDGNLVVYGNGRALWSSRTSGAPGAELVMQDDGNAVLYVGSRAVWSTGTSGTGPARLALQDDGNLVLYGARGPSWSTGAPGRETLTAGGSLASGQSLISRSGRNAAVMQPDGNFVVYLSGRVRFATGTDGRYQSAAVLQGDGNLVVYDFRGSPAWNSHTPGSGANALMMQDDGNLVLYNPSGAVFATGR